ncbi:MAG: hypothetical protein RLZZ500_2057 [Bacteroidota bacterium]
MLFSMKTIFSFLALVFSGVLANAQSEVIKYTDSLGKEATENNFYNKSVYSFQDSCKCYVITNYNAKNIPKKTVCYEDADTRIVNGQYIIYDQNGRKTYAYTYIKGSRVGPYHRWYENGMLCEVGYFYKTDETKIGNYKIQSFWNRKGVQTVKDGNGEYAFEDEFTKDNGTYIEGLKTGKWTGAFTKKANTYEEFYEQGKLIKGVTTTKEGEKLSYEAAEIQPEPIKGINHFYKYISSNFEPTNEALKKKVKGTIILSFVVEKTGYISDVRVNNSLGYGLDEEAVRLLNSYPKWKPGLQKGIPVRTSYQIPIRLDFSIGY